MSEENYRYAPKDPLDLNLIMTDSLWGKDESAPPMLAKIWANLRGFTRDLRLSNLKEQEIIFCTHYLNLSMDILMFAKDDDDPLTIASQVSMKNAVVWTEIAQSRGGFLRKQQNTFTQEQRVSQLDQKKSFISGGKKQ